MIRLTSAILQKIAPTAKSSNCITYAPLIALQAEENFVNTPVRVSAFLSQVLHESGALQYVRELWGPTPQQLLYEPPHSLARSLGNIEKGDGYKFRGRGLIQITGRANYKKLSQGLFGDNRLLDNPKLLEEPENAVRSAFFFWNDHNLNALADKLPTQAINSSNQVYYEAFKAVTKRVNGGYNGLEDRTSYYNRAIRNIF